MDEKVEEWLEKIKKSKDNMADLSRDEDLSIGIMNLISLEEHMFFSYAKTGHARYLDMLDSLRKMRVEMMQKIVKDPSAEDWCISKHLLAASMRFIEVGTKELKRGKRSEAESYFNSAFELYSLFFAINLKILDKKEKEEIRQMGDKTSIFGQMVKKILDCCKEW